MESRIVKIEAAGLRDATIASAKDDRTTMKIESITRDLGEVKVTVGRPKKRSVVWYALSRRRAGEQVNEPIRWSLRNHLMQTLTAGWPAIRRKAPSRLC